MDAHAQALELQRLVEEINKLCLEMAKNDIAVVIQSRQERRPDLGIYPDVAWIKAVANSSMLKGWRMRTHTQVFQ